MTIASQVPLSMGFSRREYYSRLPGTPPEDLPNPGIEPMSPTLAGGFFTISTTWEAHGPFIPYLPLYFMYFIFKKKNKKTFFFDTDELFL